jgi:CubicO group peptidase (beta-lactamase class C family)
MKKLYLILVAVLSIQVSFSQDLSKMEEIMNLYTSQYKFNGTVLVAHKGKILLDRGYGYRIVKDSAMHDPKSVFQIGSVTKQFTAVVILKLQEEKKLKVTDKLSKYFPDYPKGDSITIHQLLSHTSGIFNYTNDEEFMNKEVTNPASREKMMARFKDKPLDFSPGTKWSYSNSGYMLLGYIIEDVAKMSWENAVRKYIFNKAGMPESGFDFTHLQSVKKSTGYFRLKADGNTPAPIVDSSVSYAAGSIFSTTGDLYNWFLALQADKLIKSTSKEQAFTPVRDKYGYGWGIDTLAGKRSIGHSGGIHGFVSNMVFIPEDSSVVILLSNLSTQHLSAMTRHLFAVLYNRPYELPKEKSAIAMTEEELKQYTGVFDLNADLVVKIYVENGKLIGAPEGQEPLQLHPEKKDHFFLKEIEAKIRFNRNEKGEVESMTLFQNGRDITGKKRG